MKKKDTIPMIGRVSKILRDRDGNVVQEHTSGNLVVNVGKNYLLKLLTGDTAGTFIASLAVGTLGVSSGDQFTPIMPTISDTGLAGPISGSGGIKAVDSYTYNGTSPQTSVTFKAVFSSSDVNQIVSEAVLQFNNSGTAVIFARHTFPAMYLRNDKGYSLEVSWTIAFA